MRPPARPLRAGHPASRRPPLRPYIEVVLLRLQLESLVANVRGALLSDHQNDARGSPQRAQRLPGSRGRATDRSQCGAVSAVVAVPHLHLVAGEQRAGSRRAWRAGLAAPTLRACIAPPTARAHACSDAAGAAHSFVPAMYAAAHAGAAPLPDLETQTAPLSNRPPPTGRRALAAVVPCCV